MISETIKLSLFSRNTSNNEKEDSKSATMNKKQNQVTKLFIHSKKKKKLRFTKKKT